MMKNSPLFLAIWVAACGGSNATPDEAPVQAAEVLPAEVESAELLPAEVESAVEEAEDLTESIMPPVLLDATSASEPVTVVLNQHIVIRLAGNPTTGYMWSLDNQSPDVLLQVGEIDYESDPAEPGLAGVGGTFSVVLQAVKVGTGTAVLTYARARQEDDPANRIELNVTVEE